MMKIISDMILCVLLNCHIICPFPAAQIRFPAVTDLPLPPHNATSRQHNMWCLIQLLMTLYVVSSP
ncbi:hypothetical protein EF989_19880 [Salmonella enterica]|uniref:Uncharacterized protein n=3 Tax=Salmonella enterica TaxID=28901 RepID=A0A605UTR3_SALER|nr:hypothetical protein DBA32_25825 [Escherichia coli]EAB1734365.1 hypothetical protein [Salmonella enterica]EAB7395456.1 hypothetical protein [Salmonella enterica subsp. enterica serovar Typhimurium]EBC9883174.1 hypothetical protein [Salmonella enterica subsp. enterica serovar Heidelberg]EBT9820551.1 hypothetical protein [Salmonella enterica subsp. enterica]EBY4829169.1 hypothetical protein [Salmonella enterica subsp. enterica serovar Newport]EBZ5569396.1 hypothetical protein [Salmonella ent